MKLTIVYSRQNLAKIVSKRDSQDSYSVFAHIHFWNNGRARRARKVNVIDR